jgi:hypothetical protein
VKTVSHTVHVRAAAAFFGLSLGVHLAAGLLTAGGILLGARSAAAAQGDGLCMAQAECIDQKVANGGNCDGKHCFETGHNCPARQGYCYAKWAPAKLSVGFDGNTKIADLGDFMVKVYDWSMGVAAVLAAIMMMTGGFMILSSGGNSEMVKKGMARLRNAAIGLFIVAGAYTILQTVNPDLVRFRLPKFPTIKRSFMIMCTPYELCAPCGQRFYVKIPRGAAPTPGGDGLGDCSLITGSTELSAEETAKYELSAECYGKGCAKTGGDFCSDQYNRCSPVTPGVEVKIGAGCTATPECSKAFNACLSSSPAGTTCSDKLTKCNSNAAAASPSGTDQKVDLGISDTGVTNGWYCKNCKPEGSPCQRAGKDDGCCGGLCVASRGGTLGSSAGALGGSGGGGFVCSSGVVGAPCSGKEDCASGYCFTSVIAGGFCTTGQLGSPCSGGDECASGTVCAKPGDSKVATLMLGGVCSNKSDYSVCGGNQDCNSGKCVAGLCRPSSGSITKCSALGAGKGCPSEASHCPAASSASETQGAAAGFGQAAIDRIAASFGTGPGAVAVREFLSLFYKVGSTTSCLGFKEAVLVGCNTPGARVTRAAFDTVDQLCKDGLEKFFTGDAACTDNLNMANVCTPGGPGNPCTQSMDCGSGGSKGCGNGVCTNGEAGTRCDNELGTSACVAGYKCVKFKATRDQYFCVSGKEGSPCTKDGMDADCATGFKCDMAEGGEAERGSCVTNTAAKKQ